MPWGEYTAAAYWPVPHLSSGAVWVNFNNAMMRSQLIGKLYEEPQWLWFSGNLDRRRTDIDKLIENARETKTSIKDSKILSIERKSVT